MVVIAPARARCAAATAEQREGMHNASLGIGER
jgi:hypothetical protein